MSEMVKKDTHEQLPVEQTRGTVTLRAIRHHRNGRRADALGTCPASARKTSTSFRKRSLARSPRCPRHDGRELIYNSTAW